MAKVEKLVEEFRNKAENVKRERDPAGEAQAAWNTAADALEAALFEDEPKCSNCQFFSPLVVGDEGKCYRMPPTAIDSRTAMWPRVFITDLCGEHKPRPE